MNTYKLRVKTKGSFSWRAKSVALNDPSDPGALVVAGRTVIGRKLRAGDQIEVLDGRGRVVTPRFTVTR